MVKLILASKSPRRRELIEFVSDNVLCVSAEVEEYIPEGMRPQDIPSHLAKLKAESVAKSYPEDMVIGSDTVVILGDKLLLKPTNETDAFVKLRSLSGKTHKVITACAIVYRGETHSFYSETEVEFYELSDEEISEYIKTGEPMDKAGAYGIQGRGSLFVKGIKGDYFNVVGLPIAELKRKIKEILG